MCILNYGFNFLSFYNFFIFLKNLKNLKNRENRDFWGFWRFWRKWQNRHFCQKTRKNAKNAKKRENRGVFVDHRSTPVFSCFFVDFCMAYESSKNKKVIFFHFWRHFWTTKAYLFLKVEKSEKTGRANYRQSSNFWGSRKPPFSGGIPQDFRTR